jgi:tetratricopeptide (TPR) repeat protein
LLTVRERLGLPQVLDNLVLGLLLAGLAAWALLIATGRLAGQSPLVSVSRVLAVSVVAASVALGIATWLGQDEQTTGIPSVAVLPCDYEGIKDHAFLGPAAAQEIHARLAKVAGLQIPAWRSVLKSVQAGEDPQQIAGLLGVGHLARCAIARDEVGVALSTTVLDPITEELIWSGRQTYASADLVQALGEISLAIADALSVRLAADESDRVTRAPTRNPEAYEHYLRARQAQGTRQLTLPNMYTGLAIEEEDYARVMSHYRTATDLDPDFAEAWAGMATVTNEFALLAPGQAFSGSVERTYKEEAQAFARRALELDACNAEALLLTRPGMSDADVDDQVTQSGDSWGDVYQRSIAVVQRAIDCEPNNASAWLAKTTTYSNFAAWPSAGNQYPAEETRAALKKALALDPTNCPVVAYYIRIFRSRFWAPRPEDRLTLEETREAIQSALLVDPECGDMYDILYDVSVQQGRMDEAIAWKMQRHELDPDNGFIACDIGGDLAYLGFIEEAQSWIDRANDAGIALWCWDRSDFECMASRDAYFSERCKLHRLEKAKQIMASDFASASDREQVFRYRQGLYEAQTSDRPDLLRQWLQQGLEWLGTDDPVAILGKNPKRLISARYEGLELVPIFRDLGLNDAADRMLELCRRDPDDPEQIVFNMDLTLYVDARHRALAGKKAEAWDLLSRAVREHQLGPGGVPYPHRWNLLFDRALDPLRQDPEYAPRLEQLIKEYDAWLAPARERAAEAIETGDWASLRTLIDETPDMLAAIEQERRHNENETD